MNDETRRKVLEHFATAATLPPLAHVTQRGRDNQTAKYTFHFADGRVVRIGTIDDLWTRTRLSKILAVAINRTIAPIKAEDWADFVAALVAHAVEVEETPGETFEDAVREWTATYGQSATLDREGAARRGDPFSEDDQLHVTAAGVARYIRREYSENVKLPELRTALADVGFERVTVRYDRNPRGTGEDRRRSSTSYYRIAIRDLEAVSDG